MDLTTVAAQFRIPIRALRRVAAPPPRKQLTRKNPAITRITLSRAAARVRQGESYHDIAADLKVNELTLATALRKIGVTMTKIDGPKRKATLEDAVKLYKDGARVVDISEQTGIRLATLYDYLRKQEDVVLREPHNSPTTKNRTPKNKVVRQSRHTKTNGS